jgi:ABC-type multidrug transport system fused ATPase/permease subunit
MVRRLISCGFSEEKLRDKGLDYYVKIDGSNLSLGEKQLISLFRIFNTDRKIILIDEATSSIDLENEKRFLDLFYESTKGKTIINVAHRL